MKRLIITYNQSCNLKCQFCYIDFHYQKVNDRVLDIVKKAIDLKFEILTFGGGDPFSKASFRKACDYAKKNDLFVHVDTNVKAIKKNDFDFIKDNIDLLGISIDAIGKEYDEFRDTKNLFDKVDFVINHLNKHTQTPIKINTVVTKTNKDKLIEIKNYILNKKNIVRWSLYQFFPLSFAATNKELYEISEHDFDDAIASLGVFNSTMKLEVFKFKDRVHGYLFCDEEGRLYTNDIKGVYVTLFSIFDLDSTEKIEQIKELINPLTADRYVQSI
jgi:MoaA/NifB/PqqE/SkfB family radical SAM enzyme